MIRLFVRHPVTDYPTWKKAYDAFDEERRGMGVVGDAVFQATHDHNDVTIWHDFETEESAHTFMDSPRLREAMDAAGVSGDPLIWFTTRG